MYAVASGRATMPHMPPRPFRGSIAVASGLLTAAQLRRPAWRRLFPDVYIAAEIVLSHRIWCEAALIYVGYPGPYAISGLSAAYLMGVDLLGDDGESMPSVEMTAPHPRRLKTAGIRLTTAALLPGDLAAFGRVPMTSPDRTIFDIARRLSRPDAVAAIDALLHRRLTTVEDARAYALRTPGLHGRSRVGPVLRLVDGRAESVRESLLRVALVDGGLPVPEPQVSVYDMDGRFVARVDLAYRRERVAIEYEGDHHRDRLTFRRDIARVNALQAEDWIVVRVTTHELRDPVRLIRYIATLLARRRPT
jgi:very-short-patch-repair endonuclease